jgi:hypothetical protein
MYKRIIALLLCLALLGGIPACKKADVAPAKEQSAGSGFDTSKASALIEQDLYFLRPGVERSMVEWALGTPQSFVLSQNNQCVYRLAGGGDLVLTFSDKNLLETARWTDAEGKTKDLFAYLDELGIIVNYNPDGSIDQTPSDQQSSSGLPSDKEYYFSIRKHSYKLADQVLKLGLDRKTVLTAFGKPNGYSSVDFAKDGYIIDVYSMEDGSVLYLDYGYDRKTLRAAAKSKGGKQTAYLGEWGVEPAPQGLYRTRRNANLFHSLKANAKPSEIYRRLGEPDWLEGNPNRYRDAYLLQEGAVAYLDFGPNHSALASVRIVKADGKITVIELR